jgi:hypothetical protein
MGLISKTLKTSQMQNVITLTRMEFLISVDLPIRGNAENLYSERFYCLSGPLYSLHRFLIIATRCLDTSAYPEKPPPYFVPFAK